MSTCTSSRWLRVLVAVMPGLTIVGCSADARVTDPTDAQAAPPVVARVTEPTRVEPSVPDATDAEAADAAVSQSDFYCGGFSAEQPPTLLAIDLATGEPVWQLCSASTIPVYVRARALGATVLWEQDGRGAGSYVGVDDTGAEQWRRPTRFDDGSVVVSGSTVVVVTAEVDGIEASTGKVLWTHPVADGTPVGSTPTLIIEASGGPYRLSTDVAPNSPPGLVSLRGIDAVTGVQAWATEIDVGPIPRYDSRSLSVGDLVIAVPHTDGNTDIIDAATGNALRTEPGLVVAEGSLLTERDLTTWTTTALIEPFSGTRLASPDGTQVTVMPWRLSLPASAGVLYASNPPTGPAATLRLVENSTGSVRWEIPYQEVIGRSADLVFVVEGPLLQVLDADDGTVAVQYQAPTDLATFRTAVAGDGMVIVSSEWRGGAESTSPGTVVEPPDCTGGAVILESALHVGPMIVTESPDGQTFCIEIDGVETFGNVPSAPSPDPRVDSMVMFDSGAFYTFVLPNGFPQSIEIIDEQGNEMIAARGLASDYLVVFQADIGLREGMPANVERTIDLVIPGGEILATVKFAGFSTEDQEVGASFEEFISCARDHGVPILDPPAGGGMLTVAEPSSPEVLRDAWASCRALRESYFRWQQQQTPESLEHQRAVDDCLAEAGYYPALAQPVAEPAAYESAIAVCKAFAQANTPSG